MSDRLNSYINKCDLINNTQFGFQKGKSTTDAIISFLNKLNLHLDNINAISILCDLSKAFDCVNHNLLLTKLTKIGIRGIPHKWFKSYLENRSQFTIITSYTYSQNECITTKTASQLQNIERGVPQGSILGPLLFNIYINELPKSNTISDFILYADDTNILFSDKNLETLESKFETILESTNTWFNNNQLILNEDKTKYMHFNKANSNPSPSYDTNQSLNSIKPTSESKFLGITLTSNMSWHSHINQVASKVKPGIAILYKTRDLVNETILLQVYYAIVQSHLNYGIIIWGGAPQYLIDLLLKLQKKALRVIARKNMLTSCRPLFQKYKILTVPSLYILESVCYAKKVIQTKASHADSKLPLSKIGETHCYNTRQQDNIYLPNIPNKKRKLDMDFKCSEIYNKLPRSIKEIPSFKKFRTATKQFLLNNTLYSVQEMNP